MNNLAKAVMNDRKRYLMLLVPMALVFIFGYVSKYGHTAERS
jgi:hypothetical protein